MKRRDYRSECGGKRRYKTYDLARNVLSWSRHTFGDTTELNVYRCSFCRRFHIGHYKGD
jgi:hypothetical protein